jgi:hypothetical protein
VAERDIKETCDVGDGRTVEREPFARRQPGFENAEQPPRLGGRGGVVELVAELVVPASVGSQAAS